MKSKIGIHRLIELLRKRFPLGIKRLLKTLVPANVLASHELLLWRRKKFVLPAPFLVKKEVLVRDETQNVTWVETGTYKGDMTQEFAKRARHVVTIEPEPSLYLSAKQRFLDVANVTVLRGTSEEVLPTVLPEVKSPVRFWLDGHFSAGVTFQGDIDTPIRAELKAIEEFLEGWDDVSIFVDDVRCFDQSTEDFKDYPSLMELVDWAQRHGLVWSIEQDIFIARKK